MAAKAENASKFWDRYRLYLLKEKHWNGDTINELDKTTDEIMDLLGNPDQVDGFMRRGLLFSILSNTVKLKNKIFVICSGINCLMCWMIRKRIAKLQRYSHPFARKVLSRRTLLTSRNRTGFLLKVVIILTRKSKDYIKIPTRFLYRTWGVESC